jgi:hypothetical protein
MGERHRHVEPVATSARYDAARHRIVVLLTGGLEIAFDPDTTQGLEKANSAQLSRIEISPSGLGLHWPDLDADLSVPGLLEGRFGSDKWLESRRAT